MWNQIRYMFAAVLLLSVIGLVVAICALVKGVPTGVVALFGVPFVFCVWGMYLTARVLEDY
jgi:hypothetical protein